MMERGIPIDFEIPLSSVSEELWKQLKKFEPYGMGNPEPVFCTRGVSVSDIRRIGANGKHLKMKILQPTTYLPRRQAGNLQQSIDAIFFNAPPGFPLSPKSPLPRPSKLPSEGGSPPVSPIDIVYTIDMNVWNGKSNLQLKIKDVNGLNTLVPMPT